jgi:hypothetical protein
MITSHEEEQEMGLKGEKKGIGLIILIL